MACRNVERHISAQALEDFNQYLQRNSFRCLHMKLPLGYYKRFVFLLIELARGLSDWLYADVDIFLASLKTESAHCFAHDHDYGKAGMGFVVLGTVQEISDGIYREDSLVLAYFEYTIMLIILDIPAKRLMRENSSERLLQDYDDYLCSREFRLYFKETFQDTFKSVQESATKNTATLGLSATASSLGHATAGFAFTLAVDTVITIRALSHARKLRKAGEISEIQFRDTVKRRVRQTGCQLVAGSTGSMIGQIVIPVPVVGAMIGGFIGSLIGTGVSKGLDKVEDVRDLKKKPNKSFTRKETSRETGASSNSPVASNTAKGLVVQFAKKVVKSSDENISQISSKLTRKLSTRTRTQKNK